MQAVFEKIIKFIEKEIERTSSFSEHDTQINIMDYVKQEAEQYNNGWIPCSDRLPKENGYYYVTQIVKSVSTGKKIAIEKAYAEFSIGEWRRAKHLEVIAWLDIEPYQPKGE